MPIGQEAALGEVSVNRGDQTHVLDGGVGAGTGNATAPFQPASFTGVNSDAARFNAIF